MGEGEDFNNKDTTSIISATINNISPVQLRQSNEQAFACTYIQLTHKDFPFSWLDFPTQTYP